MHSSNSESVVEYYDCCKKDGDVLVSIATLVTEGRIPETRKKKKEPSSNRCTKGFYQGPHCSTNAKKKTVEEHKCDQSDRLCQKYAALRDQILKLNSENIPLCLDVILCSGCECEEEEEEEEEDEEEDINCTLLDAASKSTRTPGTATSSARNTLLLEQWYFYVSRRKVNESISFNSAQLTNAVLSQLHFSQVSAWLSSTEPETVQLTAKNIRYKLTIPGETYEPRKFRVAPTSHTFPSTLLCSGYYLNVTLLSLPRLEQFPSSLWSSHRCANNKQGETKIAGEDVAKEEEEEGDEEEVTRAANNLTNRIRTMFLDDRMHTSCMLKGKHRCDDLDDIDADPEKRCGKYANCKRICQTIESNQSATHGGPSTSANQDTNPMDGSVQTSFEFSCYQNQQQQQQQQQQQLASRRTISDNSERFDKMTEANDNSHSTKQNNHDYQQQQHVKASKVDIALSKEEIIEVMQVLNQQNANKTTANNNNNNKNDIKHQSKNKTNILRNVMLKNYHRHTNTSGNNNHSDDRVIISRCHNASETRNSFGKEINLGSSSSSAIKDDRANPTKRCGVPLVGHGDRCGDCDLSKCDNKLRENSDIIIQIKNKKKTKIYIDPDCDNAAPSSSSFRVPKAIIMSNCKMRDISNVNREKSARQASKSLFFNNKINNNNSDSSSRNEAENLKIFNNNTNNDGSNNNSNSSTVVKSVNSGSNNKPENETNSVVIEIPSSTDQARFRKSFGSAASMVFHSKTGLPLTSSPAPVRKGKKCFDFDSSINSVSAIKRALFSASISTDDESESDGSIVSPCSPETFLLANEEEEETPSAKCYSYYYYYYRYRGRAAGNLLGTFEESVLNGRLEPVSTVHGFKAELGASGSFVPKHLVCPVTVFFYTLENNSSPYLGHINLGKKGYNVPKTGTVQVTLFNPLGTVVKMFVIRYDLSDMPSNSQTFIRQRTLYLPTNCIDDNIEWGPKWLRYLIHLRFMSSKSGRIYLHSDIRMIIFRKSDLDTATAHDIDMCYELRSFTHMPSNPKYSPRK